MFNSQVLRKWVLVAVAGQILVLAFMAGKREYIYAFGEEVLLRSAPIDPRDPFRGDFVRLSYPMNSVHKSHLSSKLFNSDVSNGAVVKGMVVYAQLRSDPNGIHYLSHLSEEKSDEGLFIKGRTHRNWRWGFGGGPDYLNVRYGIEQYFVQQGKGKEMEDKMGRRDTLQVPIVMKVSLGSDGTAVIKGHQWSRLGIQIEMVRVPTARRRGEDAKPEDVLSPMVKVNLKNVSDKALSVFDFGEQCSFQLYLVDGGASSDTRLDQGCASITPLYEQVINLKPDEVYSVDLDFSLPRWHILKEGKRVEMGMLDNFQSYRVFYRSPSPEQVQGLQGEHNIWYGEMPTASFRGRGRID